MGKPLKRSFDGKTIHPDFIKEDESTYCLEEDIKSAVEWLKEELKKRSKEQWKYYKDYDERQSQGNAQGLDEAIILIDQAFPDLQPK